MQLNNIMTEMDYITYNPESRGTRASNRRDLVTEALTVKSQATFLNDAIKLWNTAPINLK